MEVRGDSLRDFCKKMPKVELHAHLNGSISPVTMEKLLKRYVEKAASGTVPELWQTAIAKGDRRTLDECFVMFKVIHTIVNNEEAVSLVAHDVVKEFAEDGVIYLELRSTPRANPKTGMTKRSYIEALLRGVKSGVEDCQGRIQVRLLLSIDRRQSVEEARDTVELAQEFRSEAVLSQYQCRVVGVDLSGDPKAGDMQSLLPALTLAKEKKLKLSLHIAEIPNRNEETKLLLTLNPDRLGHGTFLHPEVGGEEGIVCDILQRKTPIGKQKICMTSNVKGQTVPDYVNHQLGFWKERNHPTVLCTDDKGVFTTSLTEEYCIASESFSLDRRALWSLSLGSVDAVFEDRLIEQLKSVMKSQEIPL